MLRRLRPLVLVAVLLPALAACTAPEPVTVPYTAGEVTLEVGQVLVVDFGEVNPSIGDGWAVTTPPDDAVLGEGDATYPDDGQSAPGSGATLHYEFEAVGAGTTTIGFTYSYRGEEGDPEGRTEDPTPELTVTVED